MVETLVSLSAFRAQKLRADIFTSWVSELVLAWPLFCDDCGICIKCKAADALIAYEYSPVPDAHA